jgi:ketosteroid isomerase-like protein
MHKKRCSLVLWAGASLLAVASAATAAEPRQSPIVNDFVAAINAKDSKRLESLLASDFVMSKRDPACPKQQSDRDCMITHAERTLFKNNAKLTVEAVTEEYEITRANVTLTSNAIRAKGVSKISVTKEFITADGKIQSVVTTLRTDDPNTAKYRKLTST